LSDGDNIIWPTIRPIIWSFVPSNASHRPGVQYLGNWNTFSFFSLFIQKCCDKKIQHHLRMAADLNWICQRRCLFFCFVSYPRTKFMKFKLREKKNIWDKNIHEILCDKNCTTVKKTISFILFQFFSPCWI